MPVELNVRSANRIDCERVAQLTLGRSVGEGVGGEVVTACDDDSCKYVLKIARRTPTTERYVQEKMLEEADSSTFRQEVITMLRLANCNVGPRIKDAWRCIRPAPDESEDSDDSEPSEPRTEVSEYILMDRVAGVPLTDYMLGHDLSEELLHDLALQIDRMHQCGVVHDDLHTDNVMVVDSSHVVIIDFGNARLIDAPSPPIYDHDTEEGTIQSFLSGVPARPDPAWDWACIYYSLVIDMHYPRPKLAREIYLTGHAVPAAYIEPGRSTRSRVYDFLINKLQKA